MDKLNEVKTLTSDAMKAQYNVNAGCGHQVTQRLYGSERERRSRIAWMESQVGMCDPCYAAYKTRLDEAADLHRADWLKIQQRRSATTRGRWEDGHDNLPCTILGEYLQGRWMHQSLSRKIPFMWAKLMKKGNSSRPYVGAVSSTLAPLHVRLATGEPLLDQQPKRTTKRGRRSV